MGTGYTTLRGPRRAVDVGTESIKSRPGRSGETCTESRCREKGNFAFSRVFKIRSVDR